MTTVSRGELELLMRLTELIDGIAEARAEMEVDRSARGQGRIPHGMQRAAALERELVQHMLDNREHYGIYRGGRGDEEERGLRELMEAPPAMPTIMPEPASGRFACSARVGDVIPFDGLRVGDVIHFDDVGLEVADVKPEPDGSVTYELKRPPQVWEGDNA